MTVRTSSIVTRAETVADAAGADAAARLAAGVWFGVGVVILNFLVGVITVITSVSVIS